jgi:hypothetical protein
MGCAVAGCEKGVSAKGLCRRHYTAAWRMQQPDYAEKQREYNRLYAKVRLTKLTKEERAERATYQRQWRKLHQEKVRVGDHYGQRYLRMYRLTAVTYAALLQKQSGVCAICAQPPKGKRLAVDHDHRCCPGKTSCGRCVRGLVHEYCNRALGLLGDDPLNLRMGAAYLELHALRLASNGSDP